MVGCKPNIIKGIHYKTGKTIELMIKNGHIHSINEISATKYANYIIAPGLVDIQINGYLGVDFNEKPLTEIEWEKITQNLLQVGVTTFYPTIITNSFSKLSEVFERNAKYLIENPIIANNIGGFHLEGPYISKEDGPRGAHSKNFIRAPNWDEFCQLQEKAQGRIKLLTLSPEWPESYDFIKKVTQSGVKVAIGHTAANTDQIRAAVESGAELSTHIGNGAHLTMPRHPNYIWDQLAEENLWVSVIADGNHLPENFLKIIEKVKKEKTILISDSVSLAGMKPGHYQTHVGGEVTLTSDGGLHLRDNPNLLAGSVYNLIQGVQFITDNNISELSESINKASVYPSKLMDLPQQQGLTTGAPADIILFERKPKKWDIVKTYKNGEQVFQKRD